MGTILDDVERVGGRIVFVQDGLDTRSQQARLVLALLSEVARTESANIGVRVASAKRHARANGTWQGGLPPFGLRIGESGKLERDPITGLVAREMAEAFLTEQASIKTIAETLNRREVPTQRGNKWSSSVVSRMLQAPAFAGLLPESLKGTNGKYTGVARAWRDPETGETVSVGEGIITPAERLLIKRQLETRTIVTLNGKRVGNRARPRHLLTGIIHCGTCGHRCAVNGNRGGSYACQGSRKGLGCQRPAYGFAAAVEEGVVNLWVSRLISLEPGDPLLAAIAARWVAQHSPETISERATIQAALTEAETALSDLEDARYLRSEFVGSEAVKRWERLHAHLDNRVKGLRHNLAAFPLPEPDISPLLDAVLVREAWAVADIVQRRALLGLAIERVNLLPAPKVGAPFKPRERIRIVWADGAEAETRG
jgi:hypothetical protein